jgi:hypothetical protein
VEATEGLRHDDRWAAQGVGLRQAHEPLGLLQERRRSVRHQAWYAAFVELLSFSCCSILFLFCSFTMDHVCAFPAKECSSPGDLVGKLVEFGFSSSAETRTFASDVYAKVPRRASGISVRFNFLLTLFFPLHFVRVPCSWIKYIFLFVPELPETGEGGGKACPETEYLQAVGQRG